MTTRQFGDVTVTTVIELDGPMFIPDVLLPDWNEDDLEANRDWLEPRHYDPDEGLLVMPVQSFIIKTPHHTILIDGCFGNGKALPNERFAHMNTPWLERLADAGAAPEDIDVVMCTHLHGDHVGWNTRQDNGRWVPTFPNADYLFTKREWDYWTNLAEEEKAHRPHITESVLPVIDAGQSKLVDADHAVEDGIRLMPLHGHTPGHVGVTIETGDNRCVLTGDMIHHPIQCVHPDWSSSFCADPGKSAETRRNFLESHAETDWVVAPTHFPTPTFGFVERAGDAFRFRYDEA